MLPRGDALAGNFASGGFRDPKRLLLSIKRKFFGGTQAALSLLKLPYPYMEVPPLPVPVGSPPWIMKSCMRSKSSDTDINEHCTVLVLGSSLVPRPTCVFHFSAAVGLVLFLTCVTWRVERYFFAWARTAAVLRQ